MTAIIEKINEEVSRELQSKETMEALIQSTFKDFPAPMVKSAITEAMIRGFTFKNILEKDVYPIKYGNTYSLITSINYVRKIAMRSGLAGKTAPVFTFKDDGAQGGNLRPDSCTITVKRRVDGNIDEYTATVFFDEYNTGKNQWLTKPKTMIAKVAEMHAIRSGFPEETSQMFSEEEMEKTTVAPETSIDLVACGEKIGAAMTIEELKNVWKELTPAERNVDELKNLYKSQKALIESENKPK